MRRLWIVSIVTILGFTLAAPAHAAVTARPAIINGSPSNPGTFSYLAALLDTSRYKAQSAFQAQFCGGSLTTPTTVVTAAHCVVDQQSGALTQPAAVLIGLGRSLQDPSLRVVTVTAITVHPGYSIKTGDDDLAVLTLSAAQADLATITPAQATDATAADAPGTRVQVAGWGAISNFGNSFPDTFRTGDLIVLPAGTCGQGQNYNFNGLTFLGYNVGEANPLTMLCAIGVSATGAIIDSCRGDSGSPLVSGDGTAARLVGVVSLGLNCATRHPGVYTKVTAMSDFLRSTGALGGLAPPDAQVTPLNERVRITFPANAQNSMFTTFTASIADATGFEPKLCTAAPIGNGLAASCDITGLTNGSAYSVSATATSSTGTSSASGSFTVVPLAVPDAVRIKSLSVSGKRAAFVVARSKGNGSELKATRISCLPLAGGPGRSAKIKGDRATLRHLARADYACAVTARNELGTTRGPERLLHITA
ncbi:MAG: serine protease [Candidatus Nanopelagicales bacterium]